MGVRILGHSRDRIYLYREVVVCVAKQDSCLVLIVQNHLIVSDTDDWQEGEINHDPITDA